MPKPTLQIGVLTLRPGDEQALAASPLGAQVSALINQGTLKYTGAPDDWAPFNDGVTIFSHLTTKLDAFDLSSGSATLMEFGTRAGIKLFIIDPAVLLHPNKETLALFIQEHICSYDGNKASCIVFSDTLSSTIRSQLFTLCKTKFYNLFSNLSNPSLFGPRIDDLDDLSYFLRQITPLLANVPVPARSQELFNALLALNIPQVAAISNPVIGVGAH